MVARYYVVECPLSELINDSFWPKGDDEGEKLLKLC